MSRKRYTPEQIIGMLREAKVCLSQGETTRQICRHPLIDGTGFDPDIGPPGTDQCQIEAIDMIGGHEQEVALLRHHPIDRVS